MIWLYITVGYLAFAAGFVAAILLIKKTNKDDADRNKEWLSSFMNDLKNKRYVRN